MSSPKDLQTYLPAPGPARKFPPGAGYKFCIACPEVKLLLWPATLDCDRQGDWVDESTSLVPYDDFFDRFFGFSLNELMGWERNHFDRAIHLLYGLLLTYPVKELYTRIADARGFWGYFFPLELVMASSMVYELVEWGAAVVFGGELGMAFLGTQGDIWDAHKDMALATLGAFIAMLITFLINLRIQPDFWDEWKSSLTIKSNQPLGEDEIARLLKSKKQD